MPRWQARFEIVAWSVSLLCGSFLLVTHLEAKAAQRTALSLQASKTVSFQGEEHASRGAVAATKSKNPQADATRIIGRLEIPALGLTTPIIDDDDTRSLLLGAGHIKGTATPGGLGNFVVAAHRDTYFRPLSEIKPGMRMRVVTTDAVYIYSVDSTRIVLPEDVDVLDVGDIPQMTLITCYPFHYIGAAPKRFIVQGHLVSL